MASGSLREKGEQSAHAVGVPVGEEKGESIVNLQLQNQHFG